MPVSAPGPGDTAPDPGGTAPPRKILLDNPAAAPALGFREMAIAFANIISQSNPRFAVGIFGGWGSGKTTLMSAIMNALSKERIVTVEFNAWRFEREPQLLIPLLDTIRAALVQWSDDHPGTQQNPGQQQKIRSIAVRVGRVVRALATGLSVDVGLPGAVTAHYDVGTASDALANLAQPPSAQDKPNPQSLYVAAFSELENAFNELSAGEVSRVVVFVDDLDRCLPGNALDVLESMKLFFDLQGFVFVVGLDENVVERAIRAKFAEQDEPAAALADRQPAATAAGKRLGREYIKKIFQVPYSIPAMLPRQLGGLLTSLYSESELDAAQVKDLEQKVEPYLGYVANERRVNPREVKRFINAYILQTLIRRDLDAQTVVALQTFAFRYEWESFYDAILADSELFVSALRNYRAGDADAFKAVWPALDVMPPGLAGFLRSPLAQPLTRYDSLDDYLSSLQSTSTGSWTLEAYKQIENLRRAIEAALGQALTSDAARSAAEMAVDMTKAISDLLAGAALADDSSSLSAVLQRIRSIASNLLLSLDNRDTAGGVDREKLIELQKLGENARAELRLLRQSSILQPR